MIHVFHSTVWRAHEVAATAVSTTDPGSQGPFMVGVGGRLPLVPATQRSAQ